MDPWIRLLTLGVRDIERSRRDYGRIMPDVPSNEQGLSSFRNGS